MSKSKHMAKAKKPMTAAPVTSTDITLVLTGDTLSANLSPETHWAGIQKFVSMSSNDGAIAIFDAQRNYDIAEDGKSTSCKIEGAGFYRAWSSDFDYDIHLSNVIEIQ